MVWLPSVQLTVLQEQFIGIGYEVQEGLKIGFVFTFIELIIKGAFFGIGFVFFFLFDEEFGRQHFPAEVTVVEGGVVDAFIQDLELGDGKFSG